MRGGNSQQRRAPRDQWQVASNRAAHLGKKVFHDLFGFLHTCLQNYVGSLRERST